MVGAGASSQTLVLPDANTAATATDRSFEKCYKNSGTCPITGAFDSVQWDNGSGAAALPNWITFSTSGTTTQTVSITPPDGTIKGTHSIVAVFNPTNGADKTYTALTFTVGCEVASFAVSGAPGSNPTYDIFSQRSIISLTGLTFTQSPACGYTYTSSFAHTIPAGTA